MYIITRSVKLVSPLLRLPLHLHHLHIPLPRIQPIPFPPRTRKLALKPQLPRRPISEPNQPPNDAKDDADGRQDAKTVPGHTAAAFTRVEERVRVETLRGMRDVGESEI